MVGFGGEAITYWLTLWLSLQLSLDDLGGKMAHSRRGVPDEDVPFWKQHMAEVMLQFTDNDVHFFLPQLVSVLLRRDLPSREERVTTPVSSNLGSFLQARCRANHDVGMHLIWQLRAASADRDQSSQGESASRAGRIQAHSWLADFEMATQHGNNMPTQLRRRRTRYYQDSMRFIDRLVMLSFRMQALPKRFRSSEMQLELADLNKMLLRRMHTHGKAFEVLGGLGGGEWLDEQHVASECPEAAHYALHLPLRFSNDIEGTYVTRVLRIAKELCTVLPSREKAPFLIVIEGLQTNIPFQSDRVYVQGSDIGVTCQDVVAGRITPRRLLEDLANSNQGGDEDWLSATSSAGGGGGQNVADAEEEEHDKAVFERAWQELSMGNSKNPPHIQRMRIILTQVFGDFGGLREKVFREASPFGHLRGWKMASFIVKAGDDIRQEALAMQVISLTESIFRREGQHLWLRPYSIVCAGESAGLVECIKDAKSVDHVKKTTPNYLTLGDFFERLYMGKGSELYSRATENFVRSLAGYSIITYMLQVKDRHNGNILLDNRGHIIHIDFGFILGTNPGMWKHETAPFKLTQDYLDVMGGLGGGNWWRFRELFLGGFKAVQKHIDEVVALVLTLVPPNDKRALWQVELLRRRMELPKTDEEILSLIDSSANSWTTQQYDLYQKLTNEIY